MTAIPASPNLVARANEAGFHLRNVTDGRDCKADIVADITAAEEDSACPQCGNPLHAMRGVEVGNIFKLGTWFSEAMGCYFLDQDGKSRPVIMGSYGIGSGRLMACIVEAHHDDDGLIWPVSVAPYQVHLLALVGKERPQGANIQGDEASITPQEIADRLYQEFITAGIEVLYDDRDESPGVKFKDADLIGLPVRVTISERSLKSGGIEFKIRTSLINRSFRSPDSSNYSC
jgi:prolyl-tRNA synthetase